MKGLWPRDGGRRAYVGSQLTTVFEGPECSLILRADKQIWRAINYNKKKIGPETPHQSQSPRHSSQKIIFQQMRWVA